MDRPRLEELIGKHRNCVSGTNRRIDIDAFLYDVRRVSRFLNLTIFELAEQGALSTGEGDYQHYSTNTTCRQDDDLYRF